MAGASKAEPLADEISAAWDEYLKATRATEPDRYREVEPWAWTRLQNTLAKIARRTANLKRPAST